MLRIANNQSIIETIRLILSHADDEVAVVDDVTSNEVKLNSKYLLELFASGFSSQASLKSLSKINPTLLLNNLKSQTDKVVFGYGMHWFISIFDSLHDGILIADKNEIVRYINKSFERISGAKFSDVVGRVLGEARPGAKLGGVIRSGQPLFGVCRKFGDIEYMTDMHPLIINGKCMGGVTIARDITEIQHLQTKLNKYQSSYNDLLRKINKDNIAIYHFADIRGTSSKLATVKLLAEKLAASDLPILLRGESGTGKELFAHAIHLSSNRKNQPFVTVNCAAIPSPLLESELFGYSEGAFTGAKKEGKIGLIALAHNGTLFLDEIGDMNIELQAKILRVLQTGEVQPLGSINKKKINVRFIAATNLNLEEMIQSHEFREDLFYRLNVSQLYIPPLRERVEDISVLAEYFLSTCFHHSLGKLVLDSETIKILNQYTWPGNVRELQNTIRFIANITDQKLITVNYLPPVFFQRQTAKPMHSPISSVPRMTTIKELTQEQERALITAALNNFGRSVKGKKEAAKSLGISLTTLYTRISNLGIK